MAGGREYTMTFLLKAASDSSYQAAFARAKQELNNYQKAIQENNSLLKDISAYQRQEQAVERASAKVAQKVQALKEAQAAAAAAGKAAGTHTAAEMKAEAALKNANEQLKQQEAKLRQQADGLKQAGVDTNNLTGEQTRLANSTAGLKREQEALAESQNSMLDQMADMEAMAAEAYVAAQAVGQLAQEWKACVDAASGFESAMSGVQAVSGSTKEDMSELNAVAKQLGADTVYTATEIAQAMEYMGLAGWNTQEIIEGIPAVVSLTAAAGEDLSRVSDIVTDSMQALGYGTEDTAHFCDVLANTVTNANTTVDLMGDTLKYVSSTAGALGYSIEDVSTAIAAMANNGIKGSMNGTALRNILSNLAAPSEKAAAALDELGVSLVDEAGNTKALNDVISELRAGFSGLTEAEKVSYATTIAGKRAMGGMLAIVNTSQEAYDELAQTIADCEGAAENMANVRMDNLAGSVEILDGAVDALRTSIGEVYLEDLSIGAEMLAEIVDGLGEFVQANPEVVAGLTTTIGLFGGIAVAVPAATAAIKLFNAVMAGSALANPAFWGATAAVAAIAGIGTGIYKAISGIETTEEKLQNIRAEMDSIAGSQQLIDEYYALRAEMEDSALSAEELAEAKQELANVEAELAELYPEQLGGLDAQTEAYENQLETIEKVNEALAAQAAAEALAAAGEAQYEYTLAQQQYAEAAENAAEAQKNWDNALNATDSSTAISQIEAMKAAVQEDIEAGKIVTTIEGAGDYQKRLQEIANYAASVSGQEVSFGNLADVDNWLAEYEDSSYNAADATAYWSEKWMEANDEMTEAQSTMDTTAATFRDLIERGYATADDFTLSLSDMGISMTEIGEKVITGVLTQEEAMTRYGLSIEEVRRATLSYQSSLLTANKVAEESTDIQHASIREFLQSSYAIAAVTNETLSAEAAAVAFNMDLETLNEQLQLQEEYEANVAAACAAVEAGYLDAETAAERFGVSLGAMDAYNASVRLEELTEDIKELQEAYDSAYSSALSSMQGQMNLLEGLSLDAKRTRLTVSGALESMNNTASYWAEYRSNMETLQGYGLSTDFLSRFADGSSESAGYLEDLVNNLNGMSSDNAQKAVENMNVAFQNMVTQEETTAAATADLQTGYSTAMWAMEEEIRALEATVSDEMSQIVAEFNQSNQARANGLATANAFVNAIWSRVEAAKAAAAALAAAGTPNGSGGAKVNPGFATGGFTSGPSVAGEDPRYPTEAVISFNPAYRDENIGYLMKAAEMLGVGYGGTMDYMAAPQLTQDGSVYQYQGLTDYGRAMLEAYRETVRPAETAPVYLGSGTGSPVEVSVSYSPTISVNAGDSTQDIRKQLNDCDDMLLEKITKVLNDMQWDRVRRSYGS